MDDYEQESESTDEGNSGGSGIGADGNGHISTVNRADFPNYNAKEE
ncbi:MAG: hypothetical protein ACKOWP_02320 [Microbacteriaceae bacterium]